jgi:hypothetical protein
LGLVRDRGSAIPSIHHAFRPGYFSNGGEHTLQSMLNDAPMLHCQIAYCVYKTLQQVHFSGLKYSNSFHLQTSIMSALKRETSYDEGTHVVCGERRKSRVTSQVHVNLNKNLTAK